MKLSFLAMAAVGCAATLSQANVVINGGFESPINPANGWTQSGVFLQAASLTTITPHTGSFMASSAGGPRSLFTGSMSQTLPLAAGDVVEFGLFYQHISGIANANLTVVLDGQTIYSNTVGAAATSAWQSVFVPSVAIGASNPTLTISVVANSRSTIWVLDDVSVNVVPAPAPAALGLASLGLAFRRRR